jgi:hypothetical protein
VLKNVSEARMAEADWNSDLVLVTTALCSAAAKLLPVSSPLAPMVNEPVAAGDDLVAVSVMLVWVPSGLTSASVTASPSATLSPNVADAVSV